MGNVAFEALADPPRLRVADTVGNEQYELHLESPVDPEPISTDGFRYPVSDAVRLTVSGFELQQSTMMHLWSRDGELLQVGVLDDGFEVGQGEYILEICGPLKTYLRFTGAVKTGTCGDGERVEFDAPTVVDLGARSHRKQPAHTITTTDAPLDVMGALSHLGEGLMTTTPMRAYPTLRGYPPEFEIGDTLNIPEGIETGTQPVTLELPPKVEYLYEVAPLAFYLNAKVRPGDHPRVVVDGETVHSFDQSTFADDVESLLRHVLVLDCVVRTVGPYPMESVESDRITAELPEDLRELYRMDPGTRLRWYTEVPSDLVAEQSPDWPATAYVEPETRNLEAIPHIVAQLAPIRTATPERVSGAEARRAALSAFTDGGSPTRAATEVFDGEASFVDLGPSDSDSDIWIGDGVPISANKLLVEGFKNRFHQTPSEERSIDVTIVCNERWMHEEATAVRQYYHEQENLPYEVSIYECLDRASLSSLLREETGFFHYVGHATSRGLECSDGYLDVSTLSTVEVETFFLNACQSYHQAKKLVQGGAIGGIATLSDITDDQAAVVGRTTARLLNLGFPLRVALGIARSRSIVGGQYLTIGDDNASLAPAQGVPHRYVVTTAGVGYELMIETYCSSTVGVGGLYVPWVAEEGQRYLSGRTIGPFELSESELTECLQYTNVPVEFDGEFRWAFDLAAELG